MTNEREKSFIQVPIIQLLHKHYLSAYQHTKKRSFTISWKLLQQNQHHRITSEGINLSNERILVSSSSGIVVLLTKLIKASEKKKEQRGKKSHSIQITWDVSKKKKEKGKG